MIAFLMAFSDTGDPALFQIFNQVAEYTFSHVSAVSSFLRSPVQYEGYNRQQEEETGPIRESNRFPSASPRAHS